MTHSNTADVLLTDANLDDLAAQQTSSEDDNRAMSSTEADGLADTVSYRDPLTEQDWIEKDNLAAILEKHTADVLAGLIGGSPAALAAHKVRNTNRPIAKSLLRSLERALRLPDGAMSIKEYVKYEGNDYEGFKRKRSDARINTRQGRPRMYSSDIQKKARANIEIHSNIGAPARRQLGVYTNSPLEKAIEYALTLTANKNQAPRDIARLIRFIVDQARDNGGDVSSSTVERFAEACNLLKSPD